MGEWTHQQTISVLGKQANHGLGYFVFQVTIVKKWRYFRLSQLCVCVWWGGVGEALLLGPSR